MMTPFIQEKIKELVRRGAIFWINHSGGKDSQAMFLVMRELVSHKQLKIIHAHLPEVEWPDVIAHIRNTIGDCELKIVQADKTFFEMVKRRRKFPSPSTKQCTSDLKRSPIEKAIRHYTYKTGNQLIVNCLGLRAEESPGRAKKADFRLNETNSKSRREWYDMLPIHKFTTYDVFSTIAMHGQQAHWVYSEGMTRLSCCFCIMASKGDLITAARLMPELYRRYVNLEKTLRFSMNMQQKFLPEITGMVPEEMSEYEPVLHQALF